MRCRNVSVPNELLRKFKRRHFPDNFVWFTLNLGIIKETICFVRNSPDKVLTSNRCRPGDITRIIDWTNLRWSGVRCTRLASVC